MTSQSLTLLLIEDFLPDRELYRRYLSADEDRSYRLLEAETAKAGLELCRTEEIDAILVDYLLPDANGIQFLESLHAQSNGNSLPVVIVTGEGDERLAVQAIKLGAEDYLVKRWLTSEVLQLTMRSAIENAHLRLQLQQQLERERIFNRITQQIHQSLDIEQILNTAVGEVRQFLKADRAFIFRFNHDFSGVILVESIAEGWLSTLNAQIEDTCLMQTLGEDYRQGRIQVVEDVYTAGLSSCHLEMLVQFQIQANLVVPILQNQSLWGLLILNQCSHPRQWHPSEVELLQQLAKQIGIAIYQAELYQQLQAELIEHQGTEAQLRESQKWIQQVTDAIPGFIYLYDLIEERNLYTNQHITDVLGYTPEEIKAMGENLLPHLIHPDDFAQVPAHIAKFDSAQPGETFDLEYRMRRADGQWRWFMAREIVYRRTSEGLPWQILGIVQEITDRKRVEELLRESQQRFALSIESSQQGVWDYDVKSDQVYWSPQGKQLFGLAPDHAPMSMERFLHCVHPDDRDRVSAAIDAHDHTNQDHDIEYRVVWSDGRIHWLHSKGKCLRDEQGNPRQNIGTVIDITDRKELEISFKQSEQRFREIFNTTYQFIGLLTPQGILLEANQTALDFAGLSREAVVGRPFWEIRWWTISPETQQQLRQAIARAAGGAFVRYEVEVLGMGDSTTTIDFSLKPVWDESGQVVLLIPEGRDISNRLRYESDRQRLEDSLRHSEEYYRSLTGLIPQLVWIARPDGFMLDVNDRWIAYTGLTLEQIQSQGWEAIVHPEDLPTVSATWMSAQEDGSDYQSEGRKRRADGVYRWHLFQALPLKDEQGRITKWFGTSTDIHESKLSEAERAQLLVEAETARAEAETANRSKDEFISVVAHELRSPLNAVMGWAKLLQTREFDAATTRKALETISRNTQAQVQLVEDLLDISRMVRGQLRLEFTSMNLADVVRTAIETMRPTAEDKLVHLEAQISSIGCIRGDANRLQQVVLNLLTNAVKFTPEGGEIQVLLDQYNAQARIRSSDTGKGINPNFLPYIFDRFRQDQQNSTAKQGLGLGLAIVKYIIEQHGGTITAHSEGEGQGTTFTVLLPLSQVESAGTELFIPPPYDSSQTLSGLQVLLVDDDPDMLNLTALILEQSGAVVQTADGAAAALECLTQFQPDILVSDIAMPEQNGYELLRQVKAMDAVKSIPAIALTAFAGEAYREDSLRAGFAYHLTKPVEPEELVSVILGVLQRRAV